MTVLKQRSVSFFIPFLSPIHMFNQFESKLFISVQPPCVSTFCGCLHTRCDTYWQHFLSVNCPKPAASIIQSKFSKNQQIIFKDFQGPPSFSRTNLQLVNSSTFQYFQGPGAGGGYPDESCMMAMLPVCVLQSCNQPEFSAANSVNGTTNIMWETFRQTKKTFGPVSHTHRQQTTSSARSWMQIVKPMLFNWCDRQTDRQHHHHVALRYMTSSSATTATITVVFVFVFYVHSYSKCWSHTFHDLSTPVN